MQNDHFVEEDAGLGLASVDEHAFLEDGGAVVLAGARRVACRLALAHSAAVGVKLEQLVGALAHLALRVEHEAAPEAVDFPVERARSVALSALDRLGAGVGDPLPDHLTSVDLGAHDLFAGVKVEPSNHVHAVPHWRQGGALSRRRLPLGILNLSCTDSEVFSLLHSLDV